MNYWNSLAPRERLLLGIAGALIGVALIYLLCIRPILSYKSDAQSSRDIALEQYETLQKKLPATGLSASQSGTAPLNRNAVLQSVRNRQLELSRIQPEQNGALKLWFDEAPTPQIFAFMSDMTSKYAASISNVQITRKSSGFVNVTLTIRPSGA